MTASGNRTAADIMQRDVITIGPRDSLHEAMKLMTDNHVSGLAVVDVRDRCVGVVSSSDILTFEQEQAEVAADPDRGYAPYFDPETQRWEKVRLSVSLEGLAEVPVNEVMSSDVVSVPPDMPLGEVANMMLENEIHRILVLDSEQFLHGIISTVDFVQLFADSK